MNELSNHCARYATDLARIRLFKAALPNEDPRLIDILQVETILTTNAAKAKAIENERASLIDARDYLAKLFATFCEVASVAMDIEAYLPPVPETTPEINSQVETLDSLRGLLQTLLDAEGVKGREIKRVVGSIIRQEIALYHELKANGLTIDQGQTNQVFADATEKFIPVAQKLVGNDDQWANIVDNALPRIHQLIEQELCQTK